MTETPEKAEKAKTFSSHALGLNERHVLAGWLSKQTRFDTRASLFRKFISDTYSEEGDPKKREKRVEYLLRNFASFLLDADLPVEVKMRSMYVSKCTIPIESVEIVKGMTKRVIIDSNRKVIGYELLPTVDEQVEPGNDDQRLQDFEKPVKMRKPQVERDSDDAAPNETATPVKQEEETESRSVLPIFATHPIVTADRSTILRTKMLKPTAPPASLAAETGRTQRSWSALFNRLALPKAAATGATRRRVMTVEPAGSSTPIAPPLRSASANKTFLSSSKITPRIRPIATSNRSSIRRMNMMMTAPPASLAAET